MGHSQSSSADARVPDVLILGVVGEDGIGKTKFVRDFFEDSRDKNRFEKYYFFTKKQVKHNMVNYLRANLLREANAEEEMERIAVNPAPDVLFLESQGEETINTKTLSFRHAYENIQAQRLRILLVLDDVDDPTEIRALKVDRNKLFGSGSRILITSREVSVLKENVDRIHEVERMNNDAAKKLFMRPLSSSVSYNFDKFLECANGNPLAIKVLSSALWGKNDSELDSAMKKLGEPPTRIDIVLRYSYDTLKEEEKGAFLDIACFLVGESQDYVTTELDKHYPSIDVIVRTLKKRHMISISNENIEMHDALQKMAWTILHEQLREDPGKRSMLWKPEKLYELLNQQNRNQRRWMILGCSSSFCSISAKRSKLSVDATYNQS